MGRCQEGKEFREPRREVRRQRAQPVVLQDLELLLCHRCGLGDKEPAGEAALKPSHLGNLGHLLLCVLNLVTARPLCSSLSPPSSTIMES